MLIYNSSAWEKKWKLVFTGRYRRSDRENLLLSPYVNKFDAFFIGFAFVYIKTPE